MASISSLLKSAAARKAAIATEQNRVVDMEWELSAKTADDLAVYQDHYQKAAQTAKASDQISYQSKLISATRSFRSNEIQRSSIDVLEGRMDNESKQQLLINLYHSAVDNGDYDAAQGLNLQIDNLQNTILNERTAALNTAQQMVEAGYTTTKAFVADLKSGDAKIMNGYSMNEINDYYHAVGPSGIAPILDEIAASRGLPSASYMDILKDYADSTMENLQTAANNLTGADKAAVENDIRAYQTGASTFKIPGLTGKDDGISIDDINLAVESQVTGTGPFTASDNAADGRPGFIKNPISRWAITVGDDGTPNINAVYASPTVGQTAQASNLPAKNDSGQNKLDLTDAQGKGIQGNYYSDGAGNIIGDKGQLIYTAKDAAKKGISSTPSLMSPTAALQARGFTVYDGNLADLPQTANVPDLYKGQKAAKYYVDQNGLFQFEYNTPTNDAAKPMQRSLLTYDPKTDLFTSSLQKGNYTIGNKTFNSLGELIGGGGPKQNVNPVPYAPTTTADQGYAQKYAAQVKATPSLPADPLKGSYTIGGITYNAAGDIIKRTPAPVVAAPAPVTAKTPIIQAAAAAIKPPPITNPLAAPAPKKAAPIVLANHPTF